jgi:hypothetical protein
VVKAMISFVFIIYFPRKQKLDRLTGTQFSLDPSVLGTLLSELKGIVIRYIDSGVREPTHAVPRVNFHYQKHPAYGGLLACPQVVDERPPEPENVLILSGAVEVDPVAQFNELLLQLSTGSDRDRAHGFRVNRSKFWGFHCEEMPLTRPFNGNQIVLCVYHVSEGFREVFHPLLLGSEGIEDGF